MRLRRWGTVAWLLMAAVLYLFENNTGTRAVLAVSLAVPVLSAIVTATMGRRATWAWSVPTEISQGMGCEALLTVKGCGVLSVCEARISVHNLFTGEETMLAAEAKDGVCRLQIAPQHAGLLVLHAECKVTDWLGVVGRQRPVVQETALMVRPVLEQMDPSSFAGGDEGVSEGHHGGASEEKGAEIREYQPGDPVRSIHWKLSQKLDKPMIRLPDTAGSGEMRLVLDARGHDDAASLDTLGRRFLSMSAAMMENNMLHQAVWMDRTGEQQSVSVTRSTDSDALMFTLYSSGVHKEHAPAQTNDSLICGINK